MQVVIDVVVVVGFEYCLVEGEVGFFVVVGYVWIFLWVVFVVLWVCGIVIGYCFCGVIGEQDNSCGWICQGQVMIVVWEV